MARKRKSSPAATRTGDWKPRFLRHLAEMGIVTAAARATGIHFDTAYSHKKSDPVFAKGWKQALREAGDALEAEAWRRAVRGIAKPVYQQGAKVGAIQEYSDTLLIFLLKGTRPKKFRDNVKIEHDGKIKQDHTHSVDLSEFSDDELLRFERAAARRAAGTGAPGRN